MIEWISISDRLPDPDETRLLLLSDGASVHPAYFVALEHDKPCWQPKGWLPFWPPTHWAIVELPN